MRLREQQFSMRKRENVWTCLKRNADGLHKEQLTRARRSTVKKQETHAEGMGANENEERRGCYMCALFARRGAHETEIINRNTASDYNSSCSPKMLLSENVCYIFYSFSPATTSQIRPLNLKACIIIKNLYRHCIVKWKLFFFSTPLSSSWFDFTLPHLQASAKVFQSLLFVICAADTWKN